MVQQRREPCILVLSCYFTHTVQPTWHACPALRPGRVVLAVFSSASPLPSTASAAACAALFGGFAGTTGLSDFPCSSISGVRPQPSLSGPPGDQPDGRAWDLPVLAHGDSAHARVLRPRGVRRQLAITLPAMLPSAYADNVGTPMTMISRLNSPACTYPCQRFARPRGRRRMTRGHRGSLLLRCRALSSPSPCRFIPAHLHLSQSTASESCLLHDSSFSAHGALSPNIHRCSTARVAPNAGTWACVAGRTPDDG